MSPNFSKFEASRNEASRADQDAADFGARLLDGGQGKVVVLHFGAITGPPYQGEVPPLEMARPWSDRDVQFFTVYVRDPHAGGQYPQPETIEEFTRYAEDCMASDAQQIPVIVAALEGGVHQIYGGLPNMVDVIDARGTIGYRATWATHDQVSGTVDRLLRFHGATKGGKPLIAGCPPGANSRRRLIPIRASRA